MKSKIKTLLILSRCSNLPTVWSNIFSGWLLGYVSILNASSGKDIPAFFSISLGVTLLGLSLCYIGGMVLNDVYDLNWDKQYRPERPLPQGQLSLKEGALWAVGFLLFGGGLIIGQALVLKKVSLVLWVSLLLILIWIYNRWHKNNSFAPLVMALCRGLIPLIAFTMASISPSRGDYSYLLSYAGILMVYTWGLTWVAKFESTRSAPSYSTDILLFLIPIPFLCIKPVTYFDLATVFIYLAWMALTNLRYPLPQGVGKRVADRIAGISLLDFIVSGWILVFLGPVFLFISKEPNSFVAVIRQMTWSALLIPPVCFIFTLGLRRFIPST